MKAGQPCQFYHEGGHGERYWTRGWRYGIVHAIPIKGQHKNWAQITVTKGYKAGDERVWVHRTLINEVGDTTYHGATLVEEVRALKVEKAEARLKEAKALRRCLKA